jgi:hypothetical protein
MENSLSDMKMLNDIITMILKDNYIEGITDKVFLNSCKYLKEDAEIFTALYPDRAVDYLKDRKLLVFTTINNMILKMPDVNALQLKRLNFIESELLKLYSLYMELFCAVRN